jgi:hypothetical protein
MDGFLPGLALNFLGLASKRMGEPNPPKIVVINDV